MDAILNDLRLHFGLDGPPGTPAVLLIPGNGCSSTTWAPELIDGLVGLGRQVVTYDPRDTGRSSTTPDDSSYDLWDLAEDAATVLRSADTGSAVVVGHSMGAAVAQCLAIRHRALVEGLVLLAGPARPGRGFEPGPEAAITFDVDWDDRDVVIDTLTRSTGSTDDSTRSWTRSLFQDRPIPMTRRSVLRHATAAMTTVPPSDEELAGVTCPVTVIGGTADAWMPISNAEAITNDLPTARLAIVEGMGHWPGPHHIAAIVAVVGELLQGSVVAGRDVRAG